MSESPTSGFWREPPNDASNPNESGSISMNGLMHKAERAARPKPFPKPPSISLEEWNDARTGPRPVVENWLYEDVGVLIAPGGTGKTSLVLFQAIHIVLGRDLFGSKVVNGGPVVILTAEDDRESLIGRLRAVSQQMELSAEEIDHVRRNVLISDVSGEAFKLTQISNQIVKPSINTERLVPVLADIQPAVVFIDPAVSFGTGESRVNDAEQGLIEAARRIRNEAICAVMFVHHTGKQSARLQTTDQYAGRGGSAFADGSRMVHVLQPLDSGEWLKATGDTLQERETGLIFARPKISHAPPQQPIYLKRIGHLFVQYGISEDKNAALTANSEMVLELIKSEIADGRLPTGRSLDALQSGLKQRELRSAIEWLRTSGRVIDARNAKGRGGVRSYLKPTDPGEDAA